MALDLRGGSAQFRSVAGCGIDLVEDEHDVSMATYEQITQLTADVARLNAAVSATQQRGFVHALLAQSGVDGSITPGDLFTGALFVGMFTVLGGGGGSAVGALASVTPWASGAIVAPLTTTGLAGGFLVGAGVVAWKLYQDYTYTPPLELPADETETNVKYGLPLTYREGRQDLFLTLLPDVKRPLVEKMVRDTAQLYWKPKKDGQRAFSQRKTGKPFGDRLADVKVILEKVKYITPAPNGTYQFTGRGRAWLTDYL